MPQKLNFTKMHGCGNDYIYFNCHNQTINNPETLAIKLCNRYTGIGGDGIVLILPSKVADGKMRMFNSRDGSESNMCGNALPSVAKYLYENGLINGQHPANTNATLETHTMTIETGSGIKDLLLTVENNKVTAVRVDMGAAFLQPEQIPVALSGDAVVARPILIGSTKYKITCVNMGNPHAVVFISGMGEYGTVELAAIDLETTGPSFENNPLFPDRVNLEFAHVVARNHIKARVWERGSGETWGSGTGACAVAVAAVLNGYGDKDTDILVEMPGGELIVRYTDNTVYMTGNCVEVFNGVVVYSNK